MGRFLVSLLTITFLLVPSVSAEWSLKMASGGKFNMGDIELNNIPEGAPFSFTDNFDRASLGTDWSVDVGVADISSNELRCYVSAPTSGYVVTYTGTDTVQNGTIISSMESNANGNFPNLKYRIQDKGDPEDNFYRATINTNANELYFQKVVASSGSTIATESVTFTNGTAYVIKVVFTGNSHKIYVDDVLKIDTTDESFLTAGSFGFEGYQAASGTATATFYDDFSIVEE